MGICQFPAQAVSDLPGLKTFRSGIPQTQKCRQPERVTASTIDLVPLSQLPSADGTQWNTMPQIVPELATGGKANRTRSISRIAMDNFKHMVSGLSGVIVAAEAARSSTDQARRDDQIGGDSKGNRDSHQPVLARLLFRKHDADSGGIVVIRVRGGIKARWGIPGTESSRATNSSQNEKRPPNMKSDGRSCAGHTPRLSVARSG